jgi:hypothetical protein
MPFRTHSVTKPRLGATAGSAQFRYRYSPGMAGEEVLVAVEAHLAATFGGDIARATVSFLGVEPIDVLRFGPGGGTGDRPGGSARPGNGAGGTPAHLVVRYATVGMSRRPMTEPTLTPAADPGTGPRAELVLTLARPRDSVSRRLAVLAATPAVDGLVLTPDGTVELGEPLWDGARCTAVLVEPPAIPPAEAGDHTVQLLPVTPITAEELAYRRVHGAAALRAAWQAAGTDLADPDRRTVRLP